MKRNKEYSIVACYLLHHYKNLCITGTTSETKSFFIFMAGITSRNSDTKMKIPRVKKGNTNVNQVCYNVTFYIALFMI